MGYLSTLARYKEWADEVFLHTVSRLPAAELTAPRPILFGSLIRTLNHSYAMDYVWQSHLLGKHHGLTSRNPENCPDIGDLADAQRTIDRWYVDYVGSLSEKSFDEVVTFEFIGGGTGSMTRSDILLHVVNHTTYHRGHAADILYSINVFPPATDFPVFLRETRKLQHAIT